MLLITQDMYFGIFFANNGLKMISLCRQSVTIYHINSCGNSKRFCLLLHLLRLQSMSFVCHLAHSTPFALLDSTKNLTFTHV